MGPLKVDETTKNPWEWDHQRLMGALKVDGTTKRNLPKILKF